MSTPDIRPAPTASIQSQIDAIVLRMKPESTVAFSGVVDGNGWRTAVLVRPLPGKDVSFGGFIDKSTDKAINKPLTYGAFIRAEF
jgi:hypothetical protein